MTDTQRNDRMEKEEKEEEKGKGRDGRREEEGREKRERGEGRAARNSSPKARTSCLPKPQPSLQKPWDPQRGISSRSGAQGAPPRQP